jgi:hypothetical protein
MKQTSVIAGTLSLILLLTAISCTPNAKEVGGMGGTGQVSSVSSGPITDFGSVFVSGVEYETNSTVFMVDGQSGVTQNELKKGMVVLVEATLLEDNVTKAILKRTADRISYSDTVEGPVQAIEASGRTLTVMGQTILVTDKTVIDDSVLGRDLTSLMPNDVVEVSGFVSGDGVLVATLIDRKVGAPDYELKGLVKNHTTGSQTFQIGHLTVSYNGADISGMPNPAVSVWNGLPVHLFGDQFSLPPPGQLDGHLHATSVAPDSFGVQESTRAEIEGFISQMVSPNSFLVGHILVQFDTQTLFEGGTVTDLGPGARVEVTGDVSANILFARRIELSSPVKLEADLATMNTMDGISGTLTPSGLTGTVVHINAQTQFKGQGTPLHMGDLSAGDHLIVRGEPFGNEVLATDITRQPASSTVILQGPVSTTNPPSIVILGTTVDTAPLPESAFRQADDSPIGRTAFFTAAQPGVIVEVEGMQVGGSIIWQEIELQQ